MRRLTLYKANFNVNLALFFGTLEAEGKIKTGPSTKLIVRPNKQTGISRDSFRCVTPKVSSLVARS